MKKKIVKISQILICLAVFLSFQSQVQARENITDWYIKDFQSEIMVNKDSSLLITEKIIADCGNLPNKHGIFRILPTRYKTDKETAETPITLISISDFNDKPLEYKTITSRTNHTVTYKIGDPDKTVLGENYYKIKYKVQNAVRFSNLNFDEFYWNLNGNFWDIETDNFNAQIIFPEEVKKPDSQVELYTGTLGAKSKNLADYTWLNENTLAVSSTTTLLPKQGITASVTLSKNIFTPYKTSFWQKYGQYFSFLIPLFIFIFGFLLWQKLGRDPKLHQTIVPEFEVPEKLSPAHLGLLFANGHFSNKLITAEVVNLAVNGKLKIEKLEKKRFLGSGDYKLTKIADAENLDETESLILEKIFGKGKEIKLSDLKDDFYRDVPEIKKSALNFLTKEGLYKKSGLSWQIGLFIFGGILLPLSVIFFALIYPINGISFLISAIILFIFGILMPSRTQKGAELLLKIEGFKLYMETAERYRQKFNEKENIFEKFLPYAIVFGIVELWIKAMEKIYGQDFYNNYHPVWFYGTSISSFSTSDFNSAMNSLSSSISSSTGTSSGAGGGGFAGGGGGGGGGGGW